jgi:lipopolysaccharide exporter
VSSRPVRAADAPYIGAAPPAQPAQPAGSAPEDAAESGAAVRRVLLNTGALVCAYALPRVLTLGAVVLAARTLGAARFGAYGAAGAAAVIMSIVSTAGMQPLLVREMARNPRAAPRLLRAAHWLKTALNVLMLATLWLFAVHVFGLSGDALAAALLLGLGYALGSYAENLAAYFQAIERMHVWTAANAAYGIVAGLAGAALIWFTRSLPWFCTAMVLGQLACIGWLYRAYRRAHRDPVPAGAAVFDVFDARALLRSALPFAAAFLALTVYYKADVLVLARLLAPADVGIYTAAYKLVDITQALALAAIIASYPRLARAARDRLTPDRWAATRLAEVALLIVTPAAALAFLWKSQIVHVLYGGGYGAAALPAGLLAVALVPLALNLLAGYILAATDGMKLMAALYCAAAIVKLAAVAGAARLWGAAGAAAVMLGAELLLCVAFQLVLHRTMAAAPGRRALAAAATVACAGMVASWLPADHALLRGALLIALTLGAYAQFDVLPAAERALLRAALRPTRVRTPTVVP